MDSGIWIPLHGMKLDWYQKRVQSGQAVRAVDCLVNPEAVSSRPTLTASWICSGVQILGHACQLVV